MRRTKPVVCDQCGYRGTRVVLYECPNHDAYHCDDELRGCDPSCPRTSCYCECGPCTLKREEGADDV
jgi:hypothetical protein